MIRARGSSSRMIRWGLTGGDANTRRYVGNDAIGLIDPPGCYLLHLPSALKPFTTTQQGAGPSMGRMANHGQCNTSSTHADQGYTPLPPSDFPAPTNLPAAPLPVRRC